MSAPSYDDIYAIGKATLQSKRADLTVNPGDVTDAMVSCGAAMADWLVQYQSELQRKKFIDTAEGTDLDTLGDDHFGVLRNGDTFAQVAVTLSRASAGAGAGTIPAGVTVATASDSLGNRLEYTLDADVTFGGADLTKNGNATCTITGVTGNVSAAAITTIVDSIFDSSISVTNAAAAAGGNDAETDAEYRERLRAFSTVAPGTIKGLEYGAQLVSTVRVATVTQNTATGEVTLYVADGSGGSNAQMISDVNNVLPEWKAAGVHVNVVGGQLDTQNVVVSLTVRSGTDVAALSPAIVASITQYMSELGIGDTLYRSGIAAAAKAVSPSNILDVDVTTPAANVVPTSGYVIRAGSVTVG